MPKTEKHTMAEWALRISLGVMYIYSGFDLVRHPTAWLWAIPKWLQGIIESVMPVAEYVRIQGAAEILLAAVLLLSVMPRVIVKWAAFVSAVEFIAILVLGFIPWNAYNFSMTFRDIGLVGASLALYFLFLKNGNLTTTN